MDFRDYLLNNELKKDDPDYQIEEFWFLFKLFMVKFYRSVGLINNNIKIWSDILNKFKSEKKYELIEEKIKKYIGIFASDVMKYEKVNENTSSLILMVNIKRWNKISDKFHFGNSNINKKIYSLFEAFNNIKSKKKPEHYQLLEQFRNIDNFEKDNYKQLIVTCFINGLTKVLHCIESIIGYDKVLDYIEANIPQLVLTNKDNLISWEKLYKRYRGLSIK